MTKRRVGLSNLLWKLATFIAVAASLVAITRNTSDIDQVCATVQRQLDRNAASVRRNANQLEAIAADPITAREQNIPGAYYYSTHPEELRAAIGDAYAELSAYQVDAC